MHSYATAEEGTGSYRTKIVAPSMAVAVALVLCIAIGSAIWRMRRRKASARRLSQSSLLKLHSSLLHDLKFEVDKAGDLILLGMGGFGKVRIPPLDTLLSHMLPPVAWNFRLKVSLP